MISKPRASGTLGGWRFAEYLVTLLGLNSPYRPVLPYHLAVSNYPHSARGLIPDHLVTYSIQELLNGQDKELALALKLVRGRRS